MRIVSVNVGVPRTVDWNGKALETGIFKVPVAGAVAVTTTNLAGDRQADRAVHGGVDKAVYAYPSEHYAFWAAELGRDDLAWGMFGENLTVAGLDEASVRVGDRFAVGTAALEVSQPRLPCVKLAMKFGRADMVKRFLRAGRLGFYLRVVREGALEAGEPIHRIHTDPGAVTIADLALLERKEGHHPALLARAAAAEALTASWRQRYRERLDRAV